MILGELINRLQEGQKVGITSICSANKYVINAAMQHAKIHNYKLLIESTSNQVDQFGGYTGMTPEMFRDYVFTVAQKNGFPENDIILGGDHLGPNVWKNLDSRLAMDNAKEQIRAYAKAGYGKFHLDTSFVLSGDKTVEGKLPGEIITKRAAELCEVVEENYNPSGGSNDKPVYVIGTDVPIPGGAIENEEEIETTTPEGLEETVEMTKKEFYRKGLEDAWERVVAIVVQPGVEFSDSKILPYSRERNINLINKIESYENLYFEAHSTDYQKPAHLKEMVEDHFIILKVGPWLTFALREALFALAYMENELLHYRKDLTPSNLIATLENAMTSKPEYWKEHYKGTEEEIRLAMNFSYSDRIRYYWTDTTVEQSVNTLINNLSSVEIPDTLISQFLPKQYYELRNGLIKKKPLDLILSKISEVLTIYSSATGG